MLQKGENEMVNLEESKLRKEIDLLSKVALAPSIRGRLVEDTEDAVTIQTISSLFEVPREFIVRMTEEEATGGTKTVDISLANEAKIVQKALVTADDLVGAVTSKQFESGLHVEEFASGLQASDCDCACTDCNCACACACDCKCKCDCSDSSLGIARFSPYAVGQQFRTPINRMSQRMRSNW